MTAGDSSARDRAIEAVAEHLYRRFARHPELRPWARITEVERGEYRQDAEEVLRALAGATVRPVCDAEDDETGHRCNQNRDHAGDHRAETAMDILAEWPQEDTS